MKIIADLVNKDTRSKQYFIPYVLPTYDRHQKAAALAQYGHLQGKPFLIQFQSGLLPRGLFCSLVVELIQNPPYDWQPYISQEDTRHTFRNLITFSLPNAYSLSLFDQVSYLEVQIRHPKRDFQYGIYLQTYFELKQALIQTCTHLEFDHSKLQYGFLCDCGNSTEDHIAVLPVVSQSVSYAKCCLSNAYQIALTPSHLMWIKKTKDLLLPPNKGE